MHACARLASVVAIFVALNFRLILRYFLIFPHTYSFFHLCVLLHIAVVIFETSHVVYFRKLRATILQGRMVIVPAALGLGWVVSPTRHSSQSRYFINTLQFVIVFGET